MEDVMARNKKRAWSNMAGKLPPPPDQVELTPWMQEVLTLKDERASKTMAELGDEYRALAKLDEEAELAQKERNKKYRALELLVMERLKRVKEESGHDMWRGDGISFSPRYVPRPVVKDPGTLMAWIRETKQEALLTLPSSRLASIVKEVYNDDLVALLSPDQRATLKPGDPGSFAPPPGVEVFLEETITPTIKGTKKSDDAEE